MAEKDHYNHKEIEARWHKRWEHDGLYRVSTTESEKKKYYLLVEFPYPSGNLHLGHWYAFAVPDIFARYKRMSGFNVLYPIGFDSFGLPAENAAIKRGLDPREWTYENIVYMETQLRSMGNMFDWRRKVITSDPDYYRWTQWLFLRFYERGLVERKKAPVNWCESCKTVLANEQVIGGECERCGDKVVQRELLQWFFKIIEYADRLLEDLENLAWPEEIKEAQRNWIGKTKGAEIEFRIKDHESTLAVFTTRPDTLFGATYMVLAPEHPWLARQLRNSESGIRNKSEILEYLKQSQSRTEIERTSAQKEKTGVELKGITAINPGSGAEIPIWIADYVLVNYGTGAIMAVPAHDERDFEFAKKFDLPAREVITAPEDTEGVWVGSGALQNSGEFNGMSSEAAKDAVTKKVGGKTTAVYRLRDWLLSRQRYWGCPIPVVYDTEGKAHPIPEERLPWPLPDDVDFEPKGTSPLGTSKELAERTEKIFGKGWKPELDTMDTFVDSSWYFLRYLDPKNEETFADSNVQKIWMPVDRYSGGAEHTTMHLLYSRFFYKAMHDMGLAIASEPYASRLNRGLILGPDGNKMSKSKGNVVDPDEYVDKVGADAVKMYLAFIGPYNTPGSYPWDVGGVVGVRRFLDKVWRLREKASDVAARDSVLKLLHQTIKKVGGDIESFKFNTAISKLMILVNVLEKEKRLDREAYIVFLRLLAPFAPHLSEELWHSLGTTASVHLEPWPRYDEALAREEHLTIVVQVNGRNRGEFQASAGLAEEEAIQKARALPEVAKWFADTEARRIIYVPGRLVNIVVPRTQDIA